jgi:hypothetical protein
MSASVPLTTCSVLDGFANIQVVDQGVLLNADPPVKARRQQRFLPYNNFSQN